MKIGIIGSGDVGKKLAEAFIATGHSVTMGTRSPEKIAQWAREHKAAAGSFSDAASFGELVVVATLWEGTAAALELAGARNFSGKVVIDVTNPLDFSKGVPPRMAVAGAPRPALELDAVRRGRRRAAARAGSSPR